VSKANRSHLEVARQKRSQVSVGDQLKQAFPFPASGRFDDLLSALDQADKARRT
jgi:hypothetical protein